MRERETERERERERKSARGRREASKMKRRKKEEQKEEAEEASEERDGEKREERERERERNADGIISNAPQHVAPVSPPPGCQTCFFLCAIVSKAKVQRERGCRISAVPADRF